MMRWIWEKRVVGTKDINKLIHILSDDEICKKIKSIKVCAELDEIRVVYYED